MTDDYPLGADSDTDALKASFGRMLPTLAKVNEAFVQLADSLYTSPHRGDRATDSPSDGDVPTSQET